jgi:hypothetical protein
MPYIKIYVEYEEYVQIVESAKTVGASISTLIRSQLIRSQLIKPNRDGRFFEILDEVITKAESLSPNSEFTIPDLYTNIEWREIVKEINVGTLGKRFFAEVVGNNVAGVVPANEKKKRCELYIKR